MTLDEIRVLLRFKDAPQAECGEVNALLDEHIGHVATRIRELRQLEKQLKVLREQCSGVHEAAHCGILGGLSTTAEAPPAQAGTTAVRKSPATAHPHGAHGRHPPGH